MTYLPVDEMVRDADALARQFSDGSNPIRDTLTADVICHVKALADAYIRVRNEHKRCLDEVKKLKYPLCKLDTMNGVGTAMVVAEQLQGWIEDRDGLSSVPIATVTWSLDTFSVSVGDVVVWDSEMNDEEELNVDYCKDAFLRHIRDLLPFFDEAKP